MSLRERCRAFLVLGALLLAWPVWGQEPVIDFNIPPQGLAQALDALSRQGQIEIISDGTALKDKQTPGLVGSYTVRKAVEKVLAGSGLAHTFTADNAVAIKKPERVAANDAADNAPKTPEAPTAKPEEEIVTLPEMTVTASPIDDTSYNPPDATTATKTDTPIMETPVSIQVIPQQVLKDQQIVRLSKAVRNVSGVDSTTQLGLDENFTVRGFDTSGHYRNGVRVPGATGIVDLSNVERVEVLKGPASILYGRIEPGGLINIVTKQPTAEPYYALEQQFGSYDYYRTHIDTGGPLTEGGALGYRVNLSYEDAGSFREFVNTDRLFVAPMLRWNISERTWASLELEYQDETAYSDGGIPSLGSRPAPVPRERNLDEPHDGLDFEHLLVDFNLSHAFNERWSVRHHFTFRRQDSPFAEVRQRQ